MKKSLCCLLVILMLVLTACFSVRYQPYGQGGQSAGGYEDSQLDMNVFAITYHGVANSKSQTIQDWAMLRAAELSLAKGFLFFTITDKKISETVKSNTWPGEYQSAGAIEFGTNHDVVMPGTTTITRTPVVWLTISCFVDKPDISATIYDAEALQQSLRDKYNRR
jgi:hypothetical protein